MELGKVIPTEITTELSKSYLDYAMSVIVARALPDIRDGLKPVHRRILYAMHTLGLSAGAKYAKSATVVGEVLGKFHPHGDSSVYEAMVRLAQDFSMRYPLVDGQGNFGSVDGDPAAAMRYTEARLAKIASSLLLDIEKDTVVFIDNFSATVKEPTFMPALLPNLLLMGSEGIAVGMATKIPPHHLGEVIDGVVATIEKGKPVIEEKELTEEADFYIAKVEKIARGESEGFTEEEMAISKVGFESEVSIEELVKIIPGPDFPTGGIIYGGNSMADIYATGRGKIVVRGVAEIKEMKSGRSMIEITELPYQVNKALLVEKIAELVKDKKIKGIAALRDESDRNGMSVVVELKRDGKPKSVLNSLYKYTKLQSSFPANFVALVNGTPHTVNLKQILVEYVKHRQKVVVRRTVFELTNAKKRAHILEGLKIALDNLDEVIKTIRESKTQEDAKENLIRKFNFTGIQATAILDMQLRRLAALEREKIENEYNEIMKLIDKLISILRTPKKVLDIIGKEIGELKEQFDDKRRTKIYQQNLGEFSEEDLIPKTKTLVTMTRTGYVKRVDMATYKSQKRGGKGVIGMTTKEEDEIEHLISATTHDNLLFFTNKGKVFGTKVWEIEESGRQAKGTALVNLINLEQGEEIRSIVAMGDDGANNLILATRSGMVKKTAYSEFSNLRSNGLIAINLTNDDKLVSVRKTSGNDHVFLLSKEGKSIKFPEKNVRPMGRATSGVRGMSIGSKDELISMETFAEKEEAEILLITEKGIGKRTKVGMFPLQKRAGKGVKAATLTGKTGMLAAGTLVKPTMEQTIITSSNGQIIKLPLKNIPQMGRATQGVILMRFTDKEDHVAAVTALEKKEEE